MLHLSNIDVFPMFHELKNVSSQEILKELQVTYKDQCPGKQTIYMYYWISQFKSGRQDVKQNLSKAGRPQEISDEKAASCDDLTRENRRITIRRLASLLKLQSERS